MLWIFITLENETKLKKRSLGDNLVAGYTVKTIGSVFISKGCKRLLSELWGLKKTVWIHW